MKLQDVIGVTQKNPGLNLGTTEVWYKSKPSCGDAITGKLLIDPDNLELTHVCLGCIQETNLNKVYNLMQKENWSPNNEGLNLIKSCGAAFYSMCELDVIITKKSNKKIFLVNKVGFKRLHKPIFVQAFGTDND